MSRLNKAWRPLAGLAVALATVGGAGAQEAAKPSWTWGGDVRVRADFRDRAHTKPGFEKWAKLRARVGAEGQLADGKVKWGVRLATMPTGRSVLQSRNLVLSGGDLSAGNMVGIDTAYVTLVPCKQASITLGKFDNPFWATDGMFDPDLTMEGVLLGLNLHAGTPKSFAKNVTNNLMWMPLSEVPTKSADAFLVADQLRGRLGSVDTALAAYCYFSMKNAPYLNGYAHDTMSVLSLKAAYDLPVWTKSCPLAISGEVFDNVAVKQRALGAEARVDFKKVGPGRVWLAWRTVGQNATWDGPVDSEFGEHTGYQSGLRAEYIQPVWKTAQFRVAAYHFDPQTNTANKRTNRILFDLSTKF